MSKHRPERPTTCDISDIINEVAKFVNENPLWADDDTALSRLGMAYSILASMSSPEMVTDEEYEFIMGIHTTIKERIQR
jgi:hypothetical protein